MKFILGDYMNESEQFDIEYKEFCFKLQVRPNDSSASRYMTEGILDQDFYNHVEKNLDFYFREYLPKYVAVFGNSPIDNGKLYIGVKDDGQITGIPYYKDLSVQEIFQKITPILERAVTSNTGEKPKFSITVHYLNTDSTSTNIENEYEETLQRIDEFQKVFNQYMENYKRTKQEWFKQLNHYQRKIRLIANDRKERKNIIDWMIQNNCQSQELIEQLSHNRYIKGITGDYIVRHKMDSGHLMYWITQYRDQHVQMIRKNKPRLDHPSFIKDYLNRNLLQNKTTKLYSRMQLLNLLTPLRKFWLDRNPNLKYYLIEFNIAGKNQYNNDTVFFYNPVSKFEKNFCYASKKSYQQHTSPVWKAQFRYVDPDGEPHNMEYDE